LSGRATYAKGREPDLSRSRGKRTGSAIEKWDVRSWRWENLTSNFPPLTSQLVDPELLSKPDIRHSLGIRLLRCQPVLFETVKQ